MAHFKKVHYQAPKEAGRWKLGPDSDHKPSAEPKARELLRLQERPESVLTKCGYTRWGSQILWTECSHPQSA